MALSLRVLSCFLVCTCAVAVVQKDAATRCFSNDFISLVQGGVEIHRHKVQWPSIGSIIDTLGETINENTDVVRTATNNIIVEPFVKAMGAFDKSLKNLDGTVLDLWSRAKESTDELAKLTDTYLKIEVNGATDSAAVNTALGSAVTTIERVTEEWEDLIGGLDSVVKLVINDISLVGFKDAAKSVSDTWGSAIAPLQEISKKLLEVKEDIQKGSQPWTSNADTDKPLQEALDVLDEVTKGSVEKTQIIVDWFQRVADKINEQVELRGGLLLGDKASEIPTAVNPIPGDAKKLLDDSTSGLFSWVAQFEWELRKIKAVTAKAVKVAAARSSVDVPFRLSVVVGALALIALAPAM